VKTPTRRPARILLLNRLGLDTGSSGILARWGRLMSTAEGFFVDWDGNARSRLDPGGGYLCETDAVARYVAITTGSGTLVHEATFYRSMADIEKAGIRAPLVSGSHPWGRREDGF
jgi:hypothetical protein